jgi:hypothetical protein
MDPREAAGDAAPTLIIDDRPVRGRGPTMTGEELLKLAGKSPATDEIWAEGHHGQRIARDQEIPVQEGGRFVTRPRSRS